MAFKLTLTPTSPVLQNTSVQQLDYYVNIGGIHYIKNAKPDLENKSLCDLPMGYYAIDADNQPTGPQMTGLRLPRVIPVMRPEDVLQMENTHVLRSVYNIAKEHLRQLCGPDTIIIDLL